MMQSQSVVASAALEGQQEKQEKHVQFDDNVVVLPLDVGETDYVDEDRWFSQDDIASFREDTLKTVQMQRAYEKRGGQPLNEEEYCLRGLEQKMLTRPPPKSFVRRVLRLQAKQRQQQQRLKQQQRKNNNTKIISNKGDSLATSLQLFSEACSKYARKRAVQLAAEDEYDAYQIFMSGLRKQQHYDHEGDEDEDDDDDDDYDFDDIEDFDFCTESDFVNDIYDYGKYKNEPTEDETEYDDSDGMYDTIVAVDKDGKPMFVEDDPFAMDDEDDIFASSSSAPVC